MTNSSTPGRTRRPLTGPQRVVLAVGATAVLGWLVWDAVRPPRYTFDGQCLTHARGEVQRAYADDPYRIPTFRVPFNDPRASVTLPPGEEGLPVSYYKRPGAYDPERRGRLGRDPYAECSQTPLLNGLSRLGVTEAVQCHGYSTQYRPTEAPDGFGSIWMRCDEDPRIVACRLTVILPNDWEAEITLSKDLVDDWLKAAVASREFFDQHLHDCSQA